MSEAVLNLFKDRQPGLNRAHVVKGRLAMADSGSTLLGVDEKKMCATFVISTDDPDRVDDVVTTKGIYLDHFKANPICFYGHQILPLPIGKWADRESDKCTIRLEAHRALGTYYSSQRSREAEQVFALVAEGILRATSIGFNPMAEPIPRDGRKANPLSLQRGFVFPKVDLLEVSIVGIPAQPTATLVREVLARTKVAGWPLLKPIRKSLEALAEPAPEWENGATLEDDAVSKRLGKTTPKGRGGAANTSSVSEKSSPLPCGCLKKLMAMLPQHVKDALQDCVSEKIPKIKEDHPDWPDDQVQAAAFSMCGEDKELSEANGESGGYVVNAGRDGERDTDNAPRKGTFPMGNTTKQPPPPPKRPQRGGQDQAPRDQPTADQQQQHQEPDGDEYGAQQQQSTTDPKEVLGRLVDALTDYLDITAEKPQQGPPDEEEEEEEDTSGEDFDRDEMSEQEGKERYEFRSTRPRKQKGRYHAAATIKRCKDAMTAAAGHCKDMAECDKLTNAHKTASMYHHKELTAAAADLDESRDNPDAEPGATDDGERNKPPEPVQKQKQETKEIVKEPTAEELDIDLNADMILRTLLPVSSRVNGVVNAWESLQGRMPE